VSLGAGGFALAGWGRPSAPFFLGGALFYLVGTFFVTELGNGPLNDQLAAVSATDPTARDMWERYVSRWTTYPTFADTGESCIQTVPQTVPPGLAGNSRFISRILEART